MMSELRESPSALELCRRAVEGGDWEGALGHLSAVGDDIVGRPEALQLRALACYGAGDLEGAVNAFEDLYALHLERDDRIGAARAAGTVAMYLMMDTGLMAPVRGWLTRADRLLEACGDEHPNADGHDDGSVRALLAMVRTYARFLCGDRAEAPHEVAVARTVLGDAHHRAGNDPCAELEWQSARTEFERLGSGQWLDRVRERLNGPGRPTATHDSNQLTQGVDPAANVFQCDGDVRTVTFANETVLLRDLKGMRYLARLLAEPGREFHVLDLVVAEEGAVRAGIAGEDVDAVTGGGDAGFLLDEQARTAYCRRLGEIDRDIDEAELMNDPERKALAQGDREFLVAELARATGLGGRRRRAGSAAERARSSITRTLRYSIERISEHHAALGGHLEQTVETGTYCAYRPDPRVPTSWAV